MHIPHFTVDDGEYYLTVSAGGLDGPVLYAYFGRDKDVLVDNREAIDIRYHDIDKFITDGTRELIRALPEIMGDSLYSDEFQIFLNTWNLSGVIPKGVARPLGYQDDR